VIQKTCYNTTKQDILTRQVVLATSSCPASNRSRQDVANTISVQFYCLLFA